MAVCQRIQGKGGAGYLYDSVALFLVVVNVLVLEVLSLGSKILSLGLEVLTLKANQLTVVYYLCHFLHHVNFPVVFSIARHLHCLPAICVASTDPRWSKRASWSEE